MGPCIETRGALGNIKMHAQQIAPSWSSKTVRWPCEGVAKVGGEIQRVLFPVVNGRRYPPPDRVEAVARGNVFGLTLVYGNQAVWCVYMGCDHPGVVSESEYKALRAECPEGDVSELMARGA